MAKKKAKEIKFAVIDAETDPFKLGRVNIRPFLWGFFDGSIYLQFETTAELVAHIEEFDGIIYAHNGGKFDFHFLLGYLEEYSEIMIINGRIGKVQLGKCELRDSWLIIPAPLAAYKKDEIDYAIMEEGERDKPANRKKIEEYLKADCVYLWQLCERFILDYGLNLTQAGSSMKQWKKIAPIAPPETDEQFYKSFAPYYYGGRVECFERGIIKAPFSVYDINSAYPFAMLASHPYSENYSIYDGFYKGADFYRIRCKSCGAFPFRFGGDVGLQFPRDGEMREFTITKWEYAAAVDTGTLHDAEVIESILFTGHMSFEAYVLKFYALRNEAKARDDAAGSLLYKLAMNSLYGKFAANPENYANYMIVPNDEIEMSIEAGWEFGGMLGDWALAQADLAEEERHYYNVATGASITGYVRAMLWRAICASDRVLYCDTDSIAVCGRAGVTEGPDLGAWKHEGEFDRAGIAGKKLYIFRGIDGTKNKTASKGVRLSDAELWAVARGESVLYQAESVTFSVHTAPRQVARNVRMTA